MVQFESKLVVLGDFAHFQYFPVVGKGVVHLVISQDYFGVELYQILNDDLEEISPVGLEVPTKGEEIAEV